MAGVEDGIWQRRVVVTMIIRILYFVLKKVIVNEFFKIYKFIKSTTKV